MKHIHNPFLLYGYEGSEYFCDREAETQRITSALHNGRNVTLMAPRRMGKTGLIKHVFNHLSEKREDVACFYIDIFATKNMSDFVSQFGRAVIGKLDSLPEKALNLASRIIKSARIVFSPDMYGMPQASLEFQPQLADVTLSEIFQYLRQSGRECYVAIDEFQQVAEYPETKTEALLRTQVQECSNVRFIFSGSKQHMMDSIFSDPKRPFYRSTEKLFLGVIDEDKYCDFAQRLMSRAGISIPADVFHGIYARFDGHTWYVQNVLNHLYELGKPVVSTEDVERCIAEIVNSETEEYKHHYASLTLNQAHLLKAIAKEGCVRAINASDFIKRYDLKGSSSINKALQYLIDNEYAYRSSDGYIVYDRFMNQWLKEL